MNLPSISQYADSIANPFGLTRTLGEIKAERDMYGKVLIRSGNNAVVFNVTSVDSGKKLMLKCYIKNCGSYIKNIYNYISGLRDTLLSDTRLLEDELYVYDLFDNGRFYDVVAAEWTEGETLETAIRFAADECDALKLSELSAAFDRMAAEILSREWAHGDLKPENIIVGDDGILRLIDYDAMFIPELAGSKALEIGTPGYQHPLRDETFFNKRIDDYSIALISTSLRALAIDPSLYKKYNRYDNIIFYPDEILDGCSPAYEEVLRLLALNGEHLSYHLARQLKNRTREIPKLASIFNKDTKADFNNGSISLSLFESGGLWGYSDQDGSTVVEPMYEDATEFSEGLAVVKLHGIPQVIDRTGKVLVCDEKFELIKPFSCGLAAVRVDERWGFIDHNGSIVIEPVFKKAGSLREERAAVLCETRPGENKWGYMNTLGQMVIQPNYEHVTGFRKGRAEVYKGGKVLHIDLKGDIIKHS